MPRKPPPAFPVSIRGLAALGTLSSLWGIPSRFCEPGPGKGPEGDPMVGWEKGGAMLCLFLAPGREHVAFSGPDEEFARLEEAFRGSLVPVSRLEA